MNCAHCKTEFIPGSHAAHQKYCSKSCKQVVRNEEQKKARREKWGGSGMGEQEFKRLRRPDQHGRPLKSKPQREQVQRIEIPLIPIEYAFLHSPKKLRFEAWGAMEGQEKLRAAAVRTMVAMGE